jgi:glycosyltransferase involved in cell wall biosynthesis
MAAKIDSRIVFGGMIPLYEAVENELKATLLVNSRPTDMEFAKYSFPSKNMEYMVSGTPILTTKLPGMPQEYYDYIFTIDGNTPEDVTVALEKVFSFSPEKLHNKGAQAREFVLNNKNNIAQSGRILNLIGYRGGVN